MNIIKNKVREVKESFDLLRKSPFYMVVPALLDIVFLLIVGFFGSFLLSKSIPYLSNIANLNRGSILVEETSSFIAQQAEMLSLLGNVLSIFAKLAIVVFVLWLIFQGINWFLAAKCINGGKLSFKKYFLNFFVINILSALSFAGLLVLFFNITFKNSLSVNPFVSQTVINFIAFILLGVLLYFMFIGYALSGACDLKEICRKVVLVGVKCFKKVILIYFVLFLLFTMANFTIKIFSFSFPAILISGILIIMPLIAFSRVYLVKMIGEIKK